MRTPLLAGLIAILLPACVNEITGIGEEEMEEEMGSGSGSGSGSNEAVPRVAITVDRGSVTSDLNVEQTVTVTATSELGFTGDVTLAATAADTTSAAITDWTAALQNTTLTLTANGTAQTTIKLSAMGDAAALAGTLKIAATSSAAAAEATVSVTFNPVLVVAFGDNGGNCVYPTGHAVNNPWRIKAGRKLKVMNGSANKNLVVHTNGGVTGFNHEGNAGTGPGLGYEATVTTADDQDEFYCHNPGDGSAIIEGGASGTRNYVRVVP